MCESQRPKLSQQIGLFGEEENNFSCRSLRGWYRRERLGFSTGPSTQQVRLATTRMERERKILNFSEENVRMSKFVSFTDVLQN